MTELCGLLEREGVSLSVSGLVASVMSPAGPQTASHIPSPRPGCVCEWVVCCVEVWSRSSGYLEC